MSADNPWKECPDCRRYPTNDCSLCHGDSVVWHTVVPTEYEADN